ncbi:Flp pilus assembly protein CpaB [Aeromicrobium chenweiae]|uniref:Flp pilus assembly protein CpaB n=1 Tax=Aeromicrobium chenweiae TaxID=2079793 RepID=UPI00131F3655|nr:Flp pilus assembly protein CpaB [Aeromicrobium chenweiae]
MKKQYLAVAVAVLLAVLGVAALVSYANGADDRAFEGTEMVPVLRATADVPAGTPVSELSDSLETARVPRAALVPGAVTSLDDLAGQVAVVALVPGDQLSTAKLGAAETVKEDLTLSKGMQELTIPVSGARLVGGAVKAGDRVGVFSSYDGATGNPINNLLVLRVDNGVAGAEDAAGTLVTVAVKTLDAEKLVHTLEFGKIWLSKQNDDTDTRGGKAITSKDVLS